MNRLRARLMQWARPLALSLAVLVVPSTAAQAQIMGYGGFGYGFPGLGYGGFGYGYPGLGYGGLGYGGFGYGYPGLGYGGLGYGGFGFPWFGYGYGFSIPTYYNYPGYTMGLPNYITPNFGFMNPLFGLGLSPLGVESALAERYLLGRGLPSYRRYGTTSTYVPSSTYYRPYGTTGTYGTSSTYRP